MRTVRTHVDCGIPVISTVARHTLLFLGRFDQHVDVLIAYLAAPRNPGAGKSEREFLEQPKRAGLAPLQPQ